MFRKLFGLAERKPDVVAPTVDQVVRGYGAYIESAGVGFEIRDETELPYPKKTILNSMLIAQTMPGHSAELQDAMLRMTLTLAHFQPNIGEPLHSTGVNLFELDVNAPDLASQVVAGSERKALYDKMRPAIAAEIEAIGELIKKAKAIARG